MDEIRVPVVGELKGVEIWCEGKGIYSYFFADKVFHALRKGILMGAADFNSSGIEIDYTLMKNFPLYEKALNYAQGYKSNAKDSFRERAYFVGVKKRRIKPKFRLRKPQI